MNKTYLFYDIETTGLNKCFDQVIQFAAIRTDADLNEMQRYEYFFKLNKDVIPSPYAFITHRTPLSKLENGVNELEGITKIHALFNTPNTISIGYNSLGFDDEFLRFSFYRNLLPPYTHQYAQGCSRMDLYPMTVICSLFKKNLLQWPDNNLKLENISALNGFSEGQSHNAIVDVISTLKLAKCIHKDLDTWNYLSGFFDKHTDLQRCNLQDHSTDLPVAILVDGKFGFEQQYQSAVTPLGTHQHYKNQAIWLRLDTINFSSVDSEHILEHTWAINKKMGEPGFILPMKDRFLQQSLKDKQQQIQDNVSWLKCNGAIASKIKEHYRHYTYPKVASLDVAASLYDAGFMSPSDQEICKKILASSAQEKIKLVKLFSESHLQELSLRLLGHHYYEHLPTQEQLNFQNYLSNLYSGKYNQVDYKGKPRLTLKTALQEINDIEQSIALDAEQQDILCDLKRYITSL